MFYLDKRPAIVYESGNRFWAIKLVITNNTVTYMTSGNLNTYYMHDNESVLRRKM